MRHGAFGLYSQGIFGTKVSVPQIFNVISYGAVGNGSTDNYAAIQKCVLAAAAVNGCVYFPAGRYKSNRPITLVNSKAKISIRGDGPNVSVCVATAGVTFFAFSFQQLGITQPYGTNFEDLGFRPIGVAGTAISLDYGSPTATSDHFQPSTIIRNVVIASEEASSWSRGIYVRSAWNVCMTDVFISGSPQAGTWEALSGNAIEFERLCANSHFVNVHCNFWANGFFYSSGGGPNTEGLFFSNCSMVAVKKGVYILGDASQPTPRMSTFTWSGGLIECRVGGVVTNGGAAFHLVNVWTGLITGCQLITEALPPDPTYGFFLDNCAGIVVTGCDINAWIYGLVSVNNSKAINSHGNTYTNVATQNLFGTATVGSRSYGHVYFNNAPNDVDQNGGNKLGFIN